MKFNIVTIVFILCIFCVFEESNCGRILIVFHAPSYSHQVPFLPLWKELQKRGHEIVLIAANPIPIANTTNFRQISIPKYLEIFQTNTADQMMRNRFNGVPWMSFIRNDVYQVTKLFVPYILDDPNVKKLYAPNSKEKFDVVFVEMLLAPSMMAFAHRFNAPVIGISSFGLSICENYLLGGMTLPSHDSTWEMETNVGTNLSFWQRLKNFCTVWYTIYVVHHYHYPLNQELAEKYFGTPLPSILDMMKNISLVFINEDPVVTYARPELSNVIKFHSIHISKNPQPLPQDLKNFVDNATEGFIYFCLGSTMKFSDLPIETQEIFYDVFEKLPYKVVWKNEKPPLRKSDNVYVASWFSQQSLLAHPNIKLYMYQGGLQSGQEAIHYAVPLLGFPMISDQEYQLKKLQSLGVCNRLELETLTREKLKSTILEMIHNKEYKTNMIKLRRLVKDTPYDLLQNLAWWTEYVIRNKGCPHLRTSLAWQSWYQYFDTDVVAFLAVSIFIIVSIVLLISVKLLLYLYKLYQKAEVNDKKKIS